MRENFIRISAVMVLVLVSIGIVCPAAYSEWTILKGTEGDVGQNPRVLTESKNYAYTWDPKCQDISSGELRLDLSFSYKKETEEVFFVIEINDDDYNERDYLGMTFDLNENDIIDLGVMDKPYGLLANDTTAPATLMSEGNLSFAKLKPVRGPHKCTFNHHNGYTFEVSFPWRALTSRSFVVLRISFGDEDCSYDHVCVVKTEDIKLNVFKGGKNEN